MFEEGLGDINLFVVFSGTEGNNSTLMIAVDCLRRPLPWKADMQPVSLWFLVTCENEVLKP